MASFNTEAKVLSITCAHRKGWENTGICALHHVIIPSKTEWDNEYHVLANGKLFSTMISVLQTEAAVVTFSILG